MVGLWNERLCRVPLPLGLGLHVVIPATLGAPLIPLNTLMLGAYVLFPDWRHGSQCVVWDSGSPGIASFVRAFRRLDWFGVHEFEPSALAQPESPIRINGPDQSAEGYDAVRIMLERSPVTFLVAPMLGSRLAAPLGKRVYHRLIRSSPGGAAAAPT